MTVAREREQRGRTHEREAASAVTAAAAQHLERTAKQLESAPPKGRIFLRTKIQGSALGDMSSSSQAVGGERAGTAPKQLALLQERMGRLEQWRRLLSERLIIAQLDLRNGLASDRLVADYEVARTLYVQAVMREQELAVLPSDFSIVLSAAAVAPAAPLPPRSLRWTIFALLLAFVLSVAAVIAFDVLLPQIREADRQRNPPKVADLSRAGHV